MSTLAATLFTLLLLEHCVFGASPASCCNVLKSSLPNVVYYPSSTNYKNSTASYWSVQAESVQPKCVVIPKSDAQVGEIVKTLYQQGKQGGAGCQFAIRGGGHTPFAGSASIGDGVTIDLSNRDGAVLNGDKSLVKLGPGARWANVYATLDSLKLGTSGGRVAEVGVGGLTTGGGISFFSPRYGFVCNNVKNFEVVLYNGTTVNANSTHNADLAKALRGGSNNFGVITSFDMATFPSGDFWGGFLVYGVKTRLKQFSFFENFTRSETYDKYAALIMSLTINNDTKTWFLTDSAEYTKVPAQPYPPVFKPITSLPTEANTMRVTNLTDLTRELGAPSPNGQRDAFTSATYGNDAKLMEDIFQIANRTIMPLVHLPGFQFSMTYQPFPRTIYEQNRDLNTLGLDPSMGDMFNLLFTTQWQRPEDDASINAATESILKQANECAAKKGLNRRYVYLNYAAKWQKPIEGYGSEAVTFLRRVSKKYDPEGVFQKQVPGGFKLGM